MNEEDIINGIKENKAEVYTYLIDRYSKLMWHVSSGILRNVGSAEDIEDCIAECFARLWEHPEKFDPSRSSIKTYLCLLAKSRSIDRVRKINKISTMELSDVSNNEIDELEETIIRKHEIREICICLESFKEIDSEIFKLRYFYDLKASEISEKLCITSKEVSNRLYNSKKKLLELINL